MHPPNERNDSTGEPPRLDADEQKATDLDHSTDPPRSDSDDPPTDDQPFCRVFGGPTSHRVQFAGPESQPATAVDRVHNARTSADERQENDAESESDRTPTEIVLDRLAELERALEPVRGALNCGRSPDPTDIREARAKMLQLRISVEEELAPLCPGAEPWELTEEHVPGPQLVGVAEASEEIQQLIRERGDRDGSN